jgi:hypothetical protein
LSKFVDILCLSRIRFAFERNQDFLDPLFIVRTDNDDSKTELPRRWIQIIAKSGIPIPKCRPQLGRM